MHPDAQGKHESAVHSEREAHIGRARARVRWSAPRTSTMVVAGCARRASPWTRQLTGNPAAIESQNGEHSDVVRTGLCFWRIKAACEGTIRRQDMLCVPRAGGKTCCAYRLSSQAARERGRAQAWGRARHRCARYAQHVVPSARARRARCIHSLDPPEG